MKSPARISLLDDYPSILKATARLLSSAGWHADTFTDPHAFLSHAEENTPALAVLDIHMPLMDGLEVQSRLRDPRPARASSSSPAPTRRSFVRTPCAPARPPIS